MPVTILSINYPSTKFPLKEGCFSGFSFKKQPANQLSVNENFLVKQQFFKIFIQKNIQSINYPSTKFFL